MPPTAATDHTNAGVSDEKKQRAKQRIAKKKKRDDRRDEIKRGIEQTEDAEAKRKFQEELDKMDLDEKDDARDDEMKDVKPEPTDAATPLDVIPTAPPEAGGASTGAGDSTSTANPAQAAVGNAPVQSIEGGGPDGSFENPFPVDEDGDPVRTSGIEMRSQDESLAGLPFESIAVRRKQAGKTRIPRDYINMYGPRSHARFTIDEKLHLKDGRSVDDLLDVSNPIERTIDRQTRNPAERRTAADFHEIVYVAWVHDLGASKTARLKKLDPVSVKKSDEYPTRKARLEAKRQGTKLEDYPVAYVYVRWKSGTPKSWETASALRSLFMRDPVRIEKRIYATACQQEERHEQWLNRVQSGRDSSPTPGPPSTLRNETPAPDAAPKVTSGTTTTTQQAAATGTSLESGLMAFISKYRETQNIDPSTPLSADQKMDVLGNWQLVKEALKAYENMAF
jgi:hypothetical protein